MLYLDHNASTPVLPEVLEAMLPFLAGDAANPSSAHAAGRAARLAIDEARRSVARLLGAEDDEIVFTSGGTEASNLAIFGVCPPTPPPAGARARIVTSTIEHPATARPCDRLAERGYDVVRAPVDAACVVDLSAVREAVDEGTRLVTIMHANNETGALQPVREIAEHARARGALVHTDAAQSVGKVGVDVGALGVDLLTIAGHKLYAPKGVGALFVRRGVAIAPLVLGAGHERGLRPGTENVAFIVALGAACAIAARDLEVEAARQRGLRDRFLARLREGVPGLAVDVDLSRALPNTLSARFRGVSGSALLAEAGSVAASTGSACHEGDERPSPVLSAMGLSAAEARSAVRLTLGRATTDDVVERAAAALVGAFTRLTAR